MKFIIIFYLFISIFQLQNSFAQTGIVKGRVTDLFTNAPIPFSNIFLTNTTLAAVTDTNGNYILTNVPPGIYNISCIFSDTINSRCLKFRLVP